MFIHGTGVDLIEIDRIEQVVERFGDRFLKRFFSARELTYANGKANPYPHLAARFAAKEAFVKALSPISSDGVSLKDIELAAAEDLKKPELVLGEIPREILKAAGINGVHVSVSHSRRYAVATVILTK
jgi:holo-[acyl-carrier protein] synthase